VLAVLRAAGTALSPGQVRDRLGGDLAYTTAVTILSRPRAKGVLGRRKVGRAYLYQPVADDQSAGILSVCIEPGTETGWDRLTIHS
jgi:predicted transcriptional regulator